MAYLKPPAIAVRLLAPLAMRFGLWAPPHWRVPGRVSGAPRKVPVIPLEVAGRYYIVSTRGESEWVRNLRASGQAELTTAGQMRVVRATEIPVVQRPPIIEAYKKKVGIEVRGYFASLPDPADHPVFRLETP